MLNNYFLGILLKELFFREKVPKPEEGKFTRIEIQDRLFEENLQWVVNDLDRIRKATGLPHKRAVLEALEFLCKEVYDIPPYAYPLKEEEEKKKLYEVCDETPCYPLDKDIPLAELLFKGVTLAAYNHPELLFNERFAVIKNEKYDDVDVECFEYTTYGTLKGLPMFGLGKDALEKHIFRVIETKTKRDLWFEGYDYDATRDEKNMAKKQLEEKKLEEEKKTNKYPWLYR